MTSQRHLSEEDASCPESFRTSRKRTAAMTQRENRHSKHQQEGHDQISTEPKVFNDPIHGHIELPPLLHETASVQMFDHLVKVNNLEPVMEEYGLSLPTDLDFIKQQITGELDRPGNMYKGRPTEKEFLYEIVANKRTGIDVDKWDYIARDSYHLGVQTSLDHRSFIKFTRVCEVNGKNIICVSDKKVNDVYSMFNTRYSQHHRVYQDKVTTVIEEIYTCCS